MSNLIEKDDQGNWSLKRVPWMMLYTGVPMTKDVQDRLYGALWKLMEYEGTGLSPEEIERIKDNMTAMELKGINQNQVEGKGVEQNMNNLDEYIRQPNVRINGKKYVDEELLIRIFDEKFLCARKDCELEEERNGIDICRNIIANWK